MPGAVARVQASFLSTGSAAGHISSLSQEAFPGWDRSQHTPASVPNRFFGWGPLSPRPSLIQCRVFSAGCCPGPGNAFNLWILLLAWTPLYWCNAVLKPWPQGSQNKKHHEWQRAACLLACLPPVWCPKSQQPCLALPGDHHTQSLL